MVAEYESGHTETDAAPDRRGMMDVPESVARRGPPLQAATRDASQRQVAIHNKTEGVLSGLAAILVLSTPMLDPRISIGLGVALLLGLGIHYRARTRM
jgi:hypothetical protein